jgi:CubicO group peptidase (beta-lactamase class C family)
MTLRLPPPVRLLLVLLGCTLPACGRAEPEAPVDAEAALAPFDEAVRAFMEARGIPGGTLAVMRDGRVVLRRGYGTRDGAAPMPADAVLRIASLTKPVTAAAVRLLAAEGRLSLDAPAFALLGLAPPEGADPRLEQVTVRHLLEHRGGWDKEASGFDPLNGGTREVSRALGLSGPPSPQDVVRFMLGRPLDFTPGERAAYSNVGYAALGLVVERVAGQPYEAFVRERLLAPLGARDVALGRTLSPGPREPAYFDPGLCPPVFAPQEDAPVPCASGGFALETKFASSGLVAPADALVRFAAAHWMNGVPRAPGQRGASWHFGGMPGTRALLLSLEDGRTHLAVLFNSRQDSPGLTDDALRTSLEQAAERVTRWP